MRIPHRSAAVLRERHFIRAWVLSHWITGKAKCLAMIFESEYDNSFIYLSNSEIFRIGIILSYRAD